jgi:SAM-dependent methyltransferase
VRLDFAATFGDDYLYFSAARLTDEVNEQDADDVVRLLGLGPGTSVLDAPCGHGRIANLLAARGIEVVGVDASELFLDVARTAATARTTGTTASYQLGDLRELPVDGPFDAALCWFTSFGYFDDDGNRQVLREYRRVLRPGGRLLIEMHNGDEIVRRFTPAPFGAVTEIGDDVRIERSDFDCVEGRMETDLTIVRDGDVRRSHHSVRIPTITELRAWLLDAGFASATFTARDGRPPSIHHPRLLALATA